MLFELRVFYPKRADFDFKYLILKKYKQNLIQKYIKLNPKIDFNKKIFYNDNKKVILLTYVKKIDDLGRIQIPKEVRKNLFWNSGDEITIIVEKNQIILERKQLDYSNRLKELRLEMQENLPPTETTLKLFELFEKAEKILTKFEK